METIAGGKTPGLCLVEALPAEVVALGISICDTTRDGSRIVGNPEVSIGPGSMRQVFAILSRVSHPPDPPRDLIVHRRGLEGLILSEGDAVRRLPRVLRGTLPHGRGGRGPSTAILSNRCCSSDRCPRNELAPNVRRRRSGAPRARHNRRSQRKRPSVF